jgi:nicotinate phosphoribosyltransferase
VNKLKSLYQPSLALLTDLYQLTMAYGHWKLGRTEDEAVFNLFFRTQPFRGGYTIACGLEYVIDLVEDFKFQQDDIKYLAGLKGNDGSSLFEPAFLDYLKTLRLNLDIDAIEEGTVVFPQEPLLRVRGPIIQCQLIETPLLNMINFQTLIATKAARVCQAAKGEPVLEFGLRRAQGIDGALTASRAAFIGGCAATSNVLAGKLFGIPVKGTHSHSWVMSFDTERHAFAAYAEAMPNNCVFLVDTYDTLEGVKKAIEAGKQLRAGGHEMAGIRLDSGDLAYLSIEARKLLDSSGFEKTVIVASNELDENVIENLKQQGATIAAWGVGTKLVTAYDHPALNGIYKLAAVRKPKQKWEYKIKLSEQFAKINIPGLLNVRRFRNKSHFIADMIYDEPLGINEDLTIVDPLDWTRSKNIPNEAEYEDLLVPVYRHGQVVYRSPSLEELRRRTQNQLTNLHGGVKRFLNPHLYPAGLEYRLHQLRNQLVLNLKKDT